MLYFILAFLGLVVGYIIAFFTKEELKSGFIYFKVLELVTLFSLALLFLYPSFNFILFFFGLIFGFFFRFPYFYFGFGLVALSDINLLFLGSVLVFLYGLPTGSLIFLEKKWKKIIYAFVLFSFPFFTSLFHYNFLSFAAGGLLSLSFVKLWKFIKKNIKLNNKKRYEWLYTLNG